MGNPIAKYDKYLRDRALTRPWSIAGNKHPQPRQVVVIPVLGERRRLFRTVASLLDSPGPVLSDSAVVCVVNNPPPGSCPPEYIEENLETLRILEALSEGGIPSRAEPDRDLLERIANSPLRIMFVDASSSGLELPPDEAGVGLARKIGMDLSLGLFGRGEVNDRILISLDADTLVEPDYLSAILKYFQQNKNTGAVTIAFQHRLPSESKHIHAMAAYELYLRYIVIGLLWAGSPYAFHSIGSAMAFRAGAYIRAGGMNRRRMTEDFYFLQGLAKVSAVAALQDTRVFPSSRIRGRVPVIGTGAALEAALAGERDFKTLYDPAVFRILKDWLALMENSCEDEPGSILETAHSLHPELCLFLRAEGFEDVWKKLKMNAPDKERFILQLHRWFDGLKTIRLIHHLSDSLPQILFGRAYHGLFRIIGGEACISVPETAPDSGGLMEFLELVKEMEGQLVSRRPLTGLAIPARPLITTV